MISTVICRGCRTKIFSKGSSGKSERVIFGDEGVSQRMLEISKRAQLYRQEYCGCIYSLRDTNAWRAQSGRRKIKIGVKYYGREDAPVES